jgi:NADH:ubiquinone oxidoreductase subunit C
MSPENGFFEGSAVQPTNADSLSDVYDAAGWRHRNSFDMLGRITAED